jgi:DNA-binding CsgD family transcriptional regulator
VFAFGVNELVILSGAHRLFLIAALINSLGSIAYVFVAPFFYHAVLGIPMTPWTRRFYLAFDLLVLFFVVGLAWERYRGLAVIVLHALLFGMVLYGVVLVALRYRHLAEASLRRAVRVFVVLSLILFPPMYWEARPEEIAPLVRNDWLDGVALPAYYLILCALSLPFISRHVNRPAFARGGVPTPFFIREFGISEREAEIVEQLVAGRTNKEIAERLSLSPKTVENHISQIYQKTGVDNRRRLTNLLQANR